MLEMNFWKMKTVHRVKNQLRVKVKQQTLPKILVQTGNNFLYQQMKTELLASGIQEYMNQERHRSLCIGQLLSDFWI